jgi:hypothetical protein
MHQDPLGSGIGGEAIINVQEHGGAGQDEQDGDDWKG